MIVYFYLTIIIVFSIVTGIITTIVEKKKNKKIIQSVDIPTFMYCSNKVKKMKDKNIQLKVSEELLDQTVEIMDDTQQTSVVPLPNSQSDYYIPVIMSVIDPDVL